MSPSPARDPWLWAAMLLGLGLRLWGLGYGLPHVYNPDEVSIMSRALALANSGLNPGNFLYPSFYFYVLAAAVGAVATVQVATGVHTSLAAFEAAFWSDPTTVYLTGRSLSVVAGVLTIGAVYAIGLRVGTTWTARAAALLYAVAYIPVRDAHFIKHDVPATLAVTVVVLACHRVWRRGRTSDVMLAAAAAGVAFATHYYAVFAAGVVVVALWLRTHDERPADAFGARFRSLVADRRCWLAVVAFALVFAVLSPFVLIDWQTAWRDISANRAILVDRTRATFGSFGALDEHLELLIFQGAGPVFTLVAIVGAILLARKQGRVAAWLLAFPLVFLVFLSNTWPFGRTGNVLYPFMAVTCGFGLEAFHRHWRARSRSALTVAVVASVAILACVRAPLSSALVMDTLMSREDTRTRALAWIHAQVADGSGVAVEPYSVPLTPSRDWLADTLTATRGSIERAGYRARTQLERSPYPSPAYRVLHIGEGGLDEDKRYISPSQILDRNALAALRSQGLEYIVLKQFSTLESNPLREAVGRMATLVYAEAPFGPRGGIEAQLPDYDIRPSRDVERPGPIIEVWRLQ